MEETNNTTQETTEAAKVEEKYETTPIIERAREEREKMDASVLAMKLENDRRESIMAKAALGGTAEAGTTEEKKEETPKEYRQRIEKELAEGKYSK